MCKTTLHLVKKKNTTETVNNQLQGNGVGEKFEVDCKK